MRSNLLMLLVASLAVFTSCSKEECDETTVSNETLNSMALKADDFIFMRTIDKDKAKWNIRMNDIAANAYSSGKEYPVNSMIVKEKYNSSGEIDGYDIMYKAPADANSYEGWLWSQTDSKGNVIYDLSKNGKNCQNCHRTQESTN